jgi:hypothetical protein
MREYAFDLWSRAIDTIKVVEKILSISPFNLRIITTLYCFNYYWSYCTATNKQYSKNKN